MADDTKDGGRKMSDDGMGVLVGFLLLGFLAIFPWMMGWSTPIWLFLLAGLCAWGLIEWIYLKIVLHSNTETSSLDFFIWNLYFLAIAQWFGLLGINIVKGIIYAANHPNEAYATIVNVLSSFNWELVLASVGIVGTVMLIISLKIHIWKIIEQHNKKVEAEQKEFWKKHEAEKKKKNKKKGVKK